MIDFHLEVKMQTAPWQASRSLQNCADDRRWWMQTTACSQLSREIRAMPNLSNWDKRGCWSCTADMRNSSCCKFAMLSFVRPSKKKKKKKDAHWFHLQFFSASSSNSLLLHLQKEREVAGVWPEYYLWLDKCFFIPVALLKPQSGYQQQQQQQIKKQKTNQKPPNKQPTKTLLTTTPSLFVVASQIVRSVSFIEWPNFIPAAT